MLAPETIRQLVERFDYNKEAYSSPHYNEAQLRQEFLNPFFKALGWDVYNEKDYALQYREVIHEDSIHIKGSPNAKAPDYAFRLGGVRKFFVEAKKPAEDIQNTKEFAYQLKIYAWNSGLPLSILTDFEEFAVYDCRSKPNLSDSPATGRVLMIKYDEYLERWDEIASIFSPDAIRKGAFDKYADDNTAKRGTIRVDDAFLEEIEDWRTRLARNIALRNEKIINERQLNFAVQMTIDRIIFLRISEDRGIEPPNQLLELINEDQIYKRLVSLFERADLKYNSGLFHFKAESGNKNNVDTFTPSLVIDDKVLKAIIKSMYYPCPYVFKEIPVEILGQVYEQFLGKVIRLTPGGRAKIEEKPEVRKAGGVYYTPKYIVDYIVENTVGKLLEGKTPDQAAKLKIVDPACGSGSFLLGAFQYLMDWHEDYYLAHDPEKWTKGKDPALVQTADGDWRLTTDEKKRILVNNIHGVDIDQQAVEVTKLSLLLKVLEEETGQLTLGFQRALPDLNDNIKCGNSLIGWDYFEGQLLPDRAEVERVNPFDWEKNFPEVFSQGGFDAVIGNPPYIDSEWLSKTNPSLREYCNTHYESAQGNWDIFCIFVEKALKLCKRNGLSSLIVPNKLLSADYASSIREYILNNHTLLNVEDYSAVKVFPVSVYPIIYVIKTGISDENYQVLVERYSQDDDNILLSTTNKIEYREFGDLGGSSWSSILAYKTYKVTQKLLSHSVKLETIADINGAASVSEAYDWKKIITDLKDDSRDFLRFVNTGTIDRYIYLWGKKKTRYIKDTYLRPIVREIYYEKLSENRLKQAKQPKIIVAGMCKFLECNFDSGGYLAGKSTSVITSERIDLLFVLGLLNSRLLSFFYASTFSGLALQGGYFRIGPPQLKKLPIKLVKRDDERYMHMIALVKHMLELHKRTPQTPYEQELLQREIDATDAQIDRLVYDLYGLTEEEIKIVEGEG